ncbi:MAG: cobalamin-dependent protein, partial [Firmicutes bacterium]|nr:cobalamin-dependent protein [Bacillota bacterium]
LKEVMSKGGGDISYGKIILATVEGDIHDIGKNIVKVLLENYGYEVIDLGKDVPVAQVVKTAKEQNIQMVGLSALMTTTVVSMEKTIQALREAGLDCRVAVGGAVLNQEYADRIGADYYCREAMDTVKAANELFKK